MVEQGLISAAIGQERAAIAIARGTPADDSISLPIIPVAIDTDSNFQRLHDLTVEFDQILGHGNYATVYRGRIQESPVAVKVVPTNKSHIVCLLQHPTISI